MRGNLASNFSNRRRHHLGLSRWSDDWQAKHGLITPFSFSAGRCAVPAARPTGRAAGARSGRRKTNNMPRIHPLADQSSFHRRRVGGDIHRQLEDLRNETGLAADHPAGLLCRRCRRHARKTPRQDLESERPVSEPPKHVTDAFPLSDQQNKGGWVKFEPMTDEFEGKELDRSKWVVGMDWWKGRAPAWFSEKNVTVSDGKLNLTMRKEKLPPEIEKQGYKDYMSAAVHSKHDTAYGYFEVKARPMNSAGQVRSGSKEDSPGWVTEIDVFEIGGKAQGFRKSTI